MYREGVFKMDRKEIKELAKSKIKGNLWNLLWPAIVIGIVVSIPSFITGFVNGFNEAATSTTTPTTMSPVTAIITLVLSLIGVIAMVAYKKYVLIFARTGKCDFNDIINILVSEILVGLIVGIASIIIIPGIILAFAYTMVPYLVIDTDLGATDAMKESRRIMKGYKMDYFVFQLSFIGWGLLAGLTCGILLIWLAPYMEVAEAIYYDKLREKQK